MDASEDSKGSIELLSGASRVAGVCNCCLGQGEAYSMLQQDARGQMYIRTILLCYGIDVMETDIGDKKRIICDVCVRRLGDAAEFKRLVEDSLKILGDIALDAAPKVELTSMLDPVPINEDDHYLDALVEFGIKSEDEDAEEVVKLTNTSKRKRKITLETLKKIVKDKVKVPKKKRKLIASSTQLVQVNEFLDAGLIPFKYHKNHNFQCTICREKFAEISHLSAHFYGHKDASKHDAVKKFSHIGNSKYELVSSKLKCRVCCEVIDNFNNLQTHLKDCNKKAVLRFRQPLPFKLEKDQLDCPVCQKRFLNYVNLNMHMNTHYPNYICESCGKAFASKPRLRGHMRIHEIGEFPCKYCTLVFDKVTKRENHVAKEHKSGVRYSCPKCGLSLTSFYARQKHLADAHNEELKRYKCKLCPQSYITPGHLSSHVRRDHLNERNHKCDKCDLAFYTRNSLTMHMIKHDGERIYSCQVCTKSYQRAKTLKEHMRIHNNDKRFMCPVCGRAFTQKCTLKSHLKVHERKPDILPAEDSKDTTYGRQFHSV